jgi:tRNA threonylcarbamoyladenosine biosynthesis protein TsaE
MTKRTLSFSSSSAEQTALFATQIAPMLAAGDVILLEGDVGAGKTHFARALIQSLLALPEDVPSPTFTLVQTYPTQTCDIWHADLYRLTSTQEIEELGLMDAFETAICLVEWPDRLGSITPENALTLTLESGETDDTRRLTAQWSNPSWDEKVKVWKS